MTTPFDNRLANGAASSEAVASVNTSSEWKTLIKIGNVVFVRAPGKANAAPSICIGIEKPGRKNPVCSRINSAAFVELCLFFRDDEKAGRLLDQIEQTERLSEASRQAKAGIVMDAPAPAPAPAAGQANNVMAGAPWKQKPAMPSLNRNTVASMQQWLRDGGFPDAAVETDRAKLRQYVAWVIDTTGLFNQDGSRK
jgi:hypothetical protein